MANRAWNVIDNAIAPLDFRKGGSQIVGTAEYVAAEVLVSKVIRMVLKMENKGIGELAAIHLISIPFLGGAGAPFGPISHVNATDSYQKALVDGAKGVPAVLLAQWVIATAYKGFHLPWFTVKDILVTAGAKALTRPLVYAVADKLPAGQVGWEVMDELVNRQVAASNIRMRA